MALSIKDEEIESLARGMAQQRSTKMTTVIRDALRHENQRNRQERDSDERRFDVAVRRAQQMARDGAITWLATKDELLGYDEFGIPEQR